MLLKLGTYAIYRFVLPFVPAAVVRATPRLIGVLAIVGIVYAGLICWVQTDVKKLVAYSSVSHLGFCVLGLFALNTTGLTGSVLYMVNHGLSTGALFLLIGFMYERYHTRDMRPDRRPRRQDARLVVLHGLLRHGLRRPARASTASSASSSP